jgi:hypothetical protein
VRTAACLVMLLLSAGFSACNDSDRPPVGPPPAAPEPVSPRGPTTFPFVFTWKAVAGQPIYRVRVTDSAERLLYEHEVRTTRCAPSAELKAMMGDHATFTWTVGVLSADGTQVAAQSAPTAFSLK